MATRQKFLSALLVALAVVSGAGFAGWKYAIWPLNQHSDVALARRAQRFWDLKLSGDSLGAYELMAESYRRRVTPTGFAREGMGLVVHTGAKVQGASLDENGGQVEIQLKHVFNKEHFDKSEVSSLIKERWVFENGNWFRWPMGR